MDLEKIKSLIYLGYSLIDIATFLQVSTTTVHRRIDLLKNSDSLYYDIEEYEKLHMKIKENNDCFQKQYRNNQGAFKKNFVILEAIKKEEMTVQQAQRILKRNMNAILDIIKSEHFKNPNQVLKTILIQYNYFTLEEKKRLINQTNDVQKELVFVVLNFHLKKENVALLFNTDLKDVMGLYSLFPEYQDSLKEIDDQHLSVEEQKQHVNQAKKYYLRKNELINFFNKANKNGDRGKIEIYQKKLKDLQIEVNDFFDKNLSENEKKL